MKTTAFLIALLVGTLTSTSLAQSRVLDPSQMQQDVTVLRRALTTLHPGIYSYNTKEQFDRYFKDLESEVRSPMDEREFYLRLSELTARIKCGHTFLNPLNLHDDVASRIFSDRVLPFFFVVIDRRLIVTHNYSGESWIKPGDEIHAINGIAASLIIEKLLTVSRGDGNNSSGKRLVNLSVKPDDDDGRSLFDIYFPLFFPTDGKKFRLQIRHPDGRLATDTVGGVSQQDRQKSYEKEFGPIPKFEQTWDYRKLDAQTAYLKYGTFELWNSKFDWRSDIDRKFKIIAGNRDIKNLVIDIRGNEGGDDDIGDLILSHLTANPIKAAYGGRLCYRFLNDPSDLFAYLSTWDKKFKEPKDPNQYFLNEIGLYESKTADASDTITPAADIYKGKIYLMTDAINSSATFNMAWTFQENRLGTIVGEPTGGTKRGLNGGQFFFLTLPNSGFEIDLPLQHYYRKGSPDVGVIPDRIVARTVSDIASGRDGALDVIQHLIQH